MSQLTVLIDYDSGNLHSAEKAFQRMAADQNAGRVVVSSDADMVAKADRIVLPGDGAFPACKTALMAKDGLYDALIEAVEQHEKPFLGICIGMQMMASTGHEYTQTDGFDWVGGDVVPITPADPTFKVPHMGWNDLVIDTPHPVLDGLATGDHVYFVHSFHMQVSDPATRLAHVDYAGDITAIVGTGTKVGMQFHPEKSQSTGLRLISNFLNWKP